MIKLSKKMTAFFAVGVDLRQRHKLEVPDGMVKRPWCPRKQTPLLVKPNEVMKICN